VLLLLVQACAGREAVRRPEEAPRDEARLPESALRLEVISCRLAPNHEFVDVRFRVRGTERIEHGSADTYLLDEETGERYFVMELRRLGSLAEVRDGEASGVHSVIFRNFGRKLRFGSKVTVVVGPLRQEHVLLGM
jgi:hypothetical protein